MITRTYRTLYRLSALNKKSFSEVKEKIIPGQIGWVPYDWRQDPCLEWGYGGHHSHHAYDWRDDPKYNPDLFNNFRNRQWDDKTYNFPYDKKHSDWDFPTIPDNYQGTNPTQNLIPQNRPSTLFSYPMKASYSSHDDDVAHEYDYESEDLDYQCESFKMQHFRKKGGLSQWFLAGMLPIIFFYTEYIYSHYPDEDFWRIPHPPPLDHDDAGDTETYEAYQSKDAKYLVDSGFLSPIWFDIKDGQKIYHKNACVNEPEHEW